jgi:diacylglycerol kinase family enzyme
MAGWSPAKAKPAGRSSGPFGILPFGTANNIAQCLHQTPHPEVLASKLDQAKICHLDLGKVTHGGESETFLEAAGMGVFVELILAMQEWPKNLQMERAESRKEKCSRIGTTSGNQPPI